jgi:hypothetical protein
MWTENLIQSRTFSNEEVNFQLLGQLNNHKFFEESHGSYTQVKIDQFSVFLYYSIVSLASLLARIYYFYYYYLVSTDVNSPWIWRQYGPLKRWYPTTKCMASQTRRPQFSAVSILSWCHISEYSHLVRNSFKLYCFLYLFIIFAATRHIWRLITPSAIWSWGRAMPWWQGPT